MVGDSIATHLTLGDRGTWVTGVWRTWQPDAWRGRFIPAVTHGELTNGTRIVNGGQSAGLDPACEAIHPIHPAFPGESMPPFDSGWWSIPVHGFVTTGDLADRSLFLFEMPEETEGVEFWPRYRSDPDWIIGSLRATALMIVEPGSLGRLRLRARPSSGAWTPPLDLDLSSGLPVSGTDLMGLSLEMEENAAGDLAFEVRTQPGHIESAGRTMACLGAIIERRDRETGLLIGSTSCGGDTARSHQEVGDVLLTQGADLRRFYDDDYLRRFIAECGWNTFLITLGTNDLNAQFREPSVVVADLQALIDRYRRVANEARLDRPELEPPLFLVVSPATAYAAEYEARFAALDDGIASLSGGDVAVVHLHDLIQERIGSWSSYEQQLLVDGTHPNAVGAMVSAELVWNEIVSVTGGAGASIDPVRLVPIEYPTLADGLIGIEAQDIVVLGPGSYSGGLDIVTNDLLICSSHGPEFTSIEGNATERCLTISTEGTATVEIRDLLLEGGHAGTGGGLLVQSGSVLVSRSELWGCEATGLGGAIAVVDGRLDMESSIIRNCIATGAGGAVHVGSGSATFRGVEISGCESSEAGGGIHVGVDAAVLIADSLISGNRSVYGGGVDSAGDLRIESSVFDANQATLDGGGLRTEGPMESLYSIFVRNVAGQDGGGVRIERNGNSSLVSCDFEENGAARSGGALAASGGGFVTISLSRFSVHQANESGGIIHLDCHDALVESSEFEAGSAPICGAADVVCGELVLAGCSVCLDSGDFCGNVLDAGGNKYDVLCTGVCQGDLDLDGRIDGADLGLLFAGWGECPPASYCRADLNRDGVVSGLDLGLLLAVLGSGGGCD
jgi:lysophospholipase L1-like esterase